MNNVPLSQSQKRTLSRREAPLNSEHVQLRVFCCAPKWALIHLTPSNTLNFGHVTQSRGSG